MSVYAAVADSMRTTQGYQREWNSRALEVANNLPTRTEQLLATQITLQQSNVNLQYASDLVNILMRNLSQLQP
ncbi:MAG: hypothetical protein VKS61_16785 [Candidatus Sericytochromatia bacterium]|nr:hypothetical protein [Candidatus Sericytochromatia bacterium]